MNDVIHGKVKSVFPIDAIGLHEDLVKIFLKLINKKGIINIGGPTKTVYNFVKIQNPKIKKTYAKKVRGLNFPLNSSMNLSKLKKILNTI